jgi:hypothetical protein
MSDDAGVLTREMVLRAAEKLRSMPLRVCGATSPHVVHPKAFEQGGWWVCGNCFQPVLFPNPSTSKGEK